MSFPLPRFRPVALLAAALWLSVGAAAAAPSALGVTAPAHPLRPGDRFETLLSLPVEGLTSIDLTFEFDPAVLSLVSSGMADGAPAPFAITPGMLEGKPTLLLLYFDPLQGVDPKTLLRATFDVIGKPTGPDTALTFRMLVNGGVTDGGEDLLQSVAVSVVPEPTTAAFLLAGLAAGVAVRHHRKRA